MNFINTSVVQCFCIAVSSVAFSIEFNLRGKKLVLSALGGLLAWVVYLLFSGMFENDIPQYFLGAAAVSAYSEICARLTKSPAVVYLVVSIIPLVPGGDIYRTMVYFIEGKADLFLGLFMYALSIAGSIALGVFAVTSIFRLFSSIMKKLKKKKI